MNLYKNRSRHFVMMLLMVLTNALTVSPPPDTLCDQRGDNNGPSSRQTTRPLTPIIVGPNGGNLIANQINTVVCVGRLGADRYASVTIGLKDVWSATYSYQTTYLVKEVGNRPVGVMVGKVISYTDGHSRENYLNISVQIEPSDLRLHGRTLFCRSNTNHSKRDKREATPPNQSSFDVSVVAYVPSTPSMKITWTDEKRKGKVYAGETLSAICSMYIGTLHDYSPSLTWELYDSNKAFRQAWTIWHEGDVVLTEPDIEFLIKPGQKCISPEIQINSDGKCVFVSEKGSPWEVANRKCESRRYKLVAIETDEEYENLKEIIGDQAFHIGLIGDVSEPDNVYTWTANSKKFDFRSSKWKHRLAELDSPSHTCGGMHGAEIRMGTCGTQHRFICQAVPVKSTYETVLSIRTPSHKTDVTNARIDALVRRTPDKEIKGPHVQLSMSLQIKKDLAGCSLKCKASPPPEEHKEEHDIKQDTELSTPFVFRYGPLIPTLEVEENIVDSKIIINLTCSAYVGKDGSMFLSITFANRKKWSWPVGLNDRLGLKSEMPGIQIYIVNDERNDQIGRFIKAVMKITLRRKFDRSQVNCFSYDLSKRPDVVPTSSAYYLKKTHYIILQGLVTIPYTDVYRLLWVGRSDRSTYQAEKKNVWPLVVLILISVLIVILSPKDLIRRLLDNEDNSTTENTNRIPARRWTEHFQQLPEDPPQDDEGQTEKFNVSVEEPNVTEVKDERETEKLSISVEESNIKEPFGRLSTRLSTNKPTEHRPQTDKPQTAYIRTSSEMPSVPGWSESGGSMV